MPTISLEDMSTLKPAAEIVNIADTAYIELQMNAIAHEINLAALSHEYKCEFIGDIYPENLAELDKQGYVVTKVDDAAHTVNIIKFKKDGED